MTPTEPRLTAPSVEAVARVIDPEAWSRRDLAYRCSAETLVAMNQGRRSVGMPTIDEAVEPSLTKARAVLALFAAPPDEAAVENTDDRPLGEVVAELQKIGETIDWGPDPVGDLLRERHGPDFSDAAVERAARAYHESLRGRASIDWPYRPPLWVAMTEEARSEIVTAMRAALSTLHAPEGEKG